MFKFKKKNKRIGIPKIITINKVYINKEGVEQDSAVDVIHSKIEQKIIINATKHPFIPVATGISFILIEIWALCRMDEIIWSFGEILFAIFSFGFGGFSLLYGLLRPKRLFIFDRLNGTITYPEVKWNSSNTVPFKDSEWILKLHVAGRFYNGTSLAIVQNNGWSAAGFIEGEIYDLWSYLVWYMDKNRPLPPGTFFDPHRQADYERRKKEGFPPPLYEAKIPIPTI